MGFVYILVYVIFIIIYDKYYQLYDEKVEHSLQEKASNPFLVDSLLLQRGFNS